MAGGGGRVEKVAGNDGDVGRDEQQRRDGRERREDLVKVVGEFALGDGPGFLLVRGVSFGWRGGRERGGEKR